MTSDEIMHVLRLTAMSRVNHPDQQRFCDKLAEVFAGGGRFAEIDAGPDLGAIKVEVQDLLAVKRTARPVSAEDRADDINRRVCNACNGKGCPECGGKGEVIELSPNETPAATFARRKKAKAE